jgi:outer membrane receptor for ferrienterochelin and colicin
MIKSIVLFLSFLIPLSMFSQKYTISGYVEDAASGERLAGAAVYDVTATLYGAMSNNYGFYSLTIPKQELNLNVSYIGYESQALKFMLSKDTVINFRMVQNNQIEEVEIIGTKTEAEKTEIGKIDVPINLIKGIPALLGEVDVLKAIQLLPGVQSGTEGTGGFYVRGGGPDQNLILIDGVPVYNANHLFGFFSVFNSDAISDVSLIKGGFPARYGGRLSSVLDIRMKEGNMKEYKGSVSIGIISSKFLFEGPIIKDKSSFLISARRTYIDVLSWPIQQIYLRRDGTDTKSRSGYFFWDVNAKANYKFSDKDRLFLSIYTGKDKAYSNISDVWDENTDIIKSNLNWGNITTALRWNRILNGQLFMNSTLTFSRYKFGVAMSQRTENSETDAYSEFAFDYDSGIEDLAAKVDFDYNPAPKHHVKFGLNYTNHTFNPGIQAFSADSDDPGSDIDTTFGNSKIFADEYFIYAEDEIDLFKNMKTNIGVHYSGFYVDEVWYQSVQPRISLRYLLTSDWSVKAAFTQMAQYLHLLTNTTIGLPTDLWLPVTENVKPQYSDQYAVGTAYSYKGYDFSIEGYYKTMNNLIEYKEGASFLTGFEDDGSIARAWENKIEINGGGRAYGIEVLAKKNIGKTTGWIGYTFSKTIRRFPNISYGEWFPYTYDRRHDIGIVITYKFNDHIDFGGTWVFGTGNATTLALEQYETYTQWYSYYPEMGYESTVNHIDKRNNYRMPAYHRMDLSVNFKKIKKHGTRTLTVGAYNVYNRKNPFYLRFGYDENGERALYQYSLFPIIPSISYRFDF